MQYKWLFSSIMLVFATLILGIMCAQERAQVVSAEAEARNAKIWATKTRTQQEYEVIFADTYEHLNPIDHELVRSYIYWGFSAPNRGFDAMLKKFDKEHPENQYWSVRKTMINTWEARRMTEVYNKSYPEAH